MTELETRIRDAGIIAVLRGDFAPDRLTEMVEAMVSGGIVVVELTLNSTDAVEGIRRLRKQFDGRALVGAGTVRSASDVELALSAGAKFLVAPNLDLPSVVRAHEGGVPMLPGVFTPSEAQSAHAAGCGLVKLFPIDAVGPAYLRALRAPLNDIGFIAVGGVDENNLADYVRAGAVAVGVGSSLVRGDHESGEVIEARAVRMVTALRAARAN